MQNYREEVLAVRNCLIESETEAAKDPQSRSSLVWQFDRSPHYLQKTCKTRCQILLSDSFGPIIDVPQARQGFHEEFEHMKRQASNRNPLDDMLL